MLDALKDGLGAMWRRTAWIAGAALPLLSGLAPSLSGQTPVVARDSSRMYERVYRLQAGRADTTYRRALRLARQELELRLDSLQHAFDEMGLDAPERRDLARELRTLIMSLTNLSQLEQQRARLRIAPEAPTPDDDGEVVGHSEVFALPRLSIATLQPGWIGINAEAPHNWIVRNDSAFIRYFGYPEIVSVEPNSPAEHAGIERGDQLIAYDGANVRDREINLTSLLQPSRHITITVRRDGEERQVPVVVARAPARLIERRRLATPEAIPDSFRKRARTMVLRTPGAAPTPPRLFSFDEMDPASAPVAGAKLTEIRNEELGHIFGVSRGVLVTEVFSDPARGSGLRGGDVLLRADGRDLTSVAQLRRIVAAHGGDRAVELEVVRQKRTRTITLRW